MPEHSSDIHHLGPHTTEIRLLADRCPAMRRIGLKHVGCIDAKPPFYVHRASTGGAFLLACHGGEGEVMIEGEWRRLRAGTACLSPPHLRYGLRALPGKPWQFCWVRYDEEIEAPLAWRRFMPQSAPFQAGPLHAAIIGLDAELHGPPDPAAQALWVEIIQLSALRFAPTHTLDQRLTRLWTQVGSRLHHPWTIESLAARLHMSGEHLRRLCLDQLGRSPRRHLLSLRMRRAIELLSTTDDKQETIAKAVGYADLFTFSKAFKRWSGLPPSHFRSRHRETAQPAEYR